MTISLRGSQFFEHWSVLVRRRWIIYLVVALVSVGVLIASFMTTPLYRATVVLQIERQNPDVLTFSDLSKIDYAWVAYSDFYQTQYRVMASAPVARLAASELHLDSHPAFNPEPSAPGLLSRLRALFPQKGVTAEPDPLELAASAILGSLEVLPVPNSHLVHLSFVDSDPELAADVANAMARAYATNNVRTQSDAHIGAEGFLIDQIVNLKAQVNRAEHQLREYGDEAGILSIEDADNLQMQALKEIALRQAEVATARAEAEARYRAVQQVAPGALPEVLQSELVARLREEYARYEAEHSENSRRFKDDWPGMQTLQSKLDQARSRLEMEIQQIAKQVRASAASTYAQTLEQERSLSTLLESREDEAQRLKFDAIEYATLQTEVRKKRETLNRLIKRENEMDLSAELLELDPSSSPTNIRVMERARTPLAPFTPRTKLNLALSLIFGLLLGTGLAVIVDYLDSSIKTVADVARVVDLPVLAAIPLDGDPPARARIRARLDVTAVRNFDLITHGDSHCPAAEAYRELRTSLLLSHAGQPPRLITVTSALPEEGKSATTMNLAIVLSQLGKRVLLVDTDLRRPRLHLALDASNERGVSTYLSGLEQLTSRLVVATQVPKLDLLPSGPIPPNPSELLNSPRFGQLGDELLAQGYDHILFDSPPVLSVPDPLILANAVDSAILVVRAGRTPRQSVKLAGDKLSPASRGPVGIVVNGLQLEARDYAHRYYYGSRETPTSSDDAPLKHRGGVGS